MRCSCGEWEPSYLIEAKRLNGALPDRRFVLCMECLDRVASPEPGLKFNRGISNELHLVDYGKYSVVFYLMSSFGGFLERAGTRSIPVFGSVAAARKYWLDHLGGLPPICAMDVDTYSGLDYSITSRMYFDS